MKHENEKWNSLLSLFAESSLDIKMSYEFLESNVTRIPKWQHFVTIHKRLRIFLLGIWFISWAWSLSFHSAATQINKWGSSCGFALTFTVSPEFWGSSEHIRFILLWYMHSPNKNSEYGKSLKGERINLICWFQLSIETCSTSFYKPIFLCTLSSKGHLLF